MINQVTLVGRLTKDPDLRITPDGTSVVNLILAVNRQFKNQNGDYDTDFVSCTIWRKTAENTANYCRKGSIVGITGKIHTRNYQNQEGKKVYVTEVVAETVQFLSKRPSEELRTQGGQSSTEEWKVSAERGSGNSVPVQSSSSADQRNGTGDRNFSNENRSLPGEWRRSSDQVSSDQRINFGQKEDENVTTAAGGVR